MKLHYITTSIKQLSVFIVGSLFLISCGSSQNLSDNDGIYGDDTVVKKETKKEVVVIDNDKDYKEYNDNYFTKEVERLDLLNGTNIFTDIENYSSLDADTDEVEEEIYDENSRITYNSSEPWGYSSDNDIVININTLGPGFYDPFWGFDPFWGPGFGICRPWGWGWNPWRPRWRWSRWGFYGGYYNRIALMGNPFFNNPYYNVYWNPGGYYEYNSFYNNRYNRRRFNSNRRSSITRRGTTARRGNRTISRRSSNVYRRNSNGRRVIRNSNGTRVRSNNSTRPRRSSTIRRNTPRRSSSGVRNSSSNRRSFSTRSNRSSNRSSIRSSRSSSRSSARSSSSRSSSRGRRG